MTEFVIEGKYPKYDILVDGQKVDEAGDMRQIFLSVMHRFEQGDVLRWDKPPATWRKGQRVTTETGNLLGTVLDDAGAHLQAANSSVRASRTLADALSIMHKKEGDPPFRTTIGDGS